MNLGKILSNLIDRKSSAYHLTYSHQFDGFFTNLNNIPNISEIKISNILLITDQSPYSLISIAYMVRFNEALGNSSSLFAITEKKHTQVIENICEENNIKLQEIFELNNHSIDDIKDYIIKNDISLIIISYAHKLKQIILENVPVSVLVTSLKNI